MFRTILILTTLAAVAFGTPVNQLGKRVSVGGTPAFLGQVPYQASMRNAEQQHLGSGAIISTRWILTHAEVTHGRTPAGIFSVIGSLLLTGVAGHSFSSVAVVTHPQFDLANFLNELGLVQTTNPIPLTIDVQSRPMASVFFPSGVNAMSSGWGSVNRDQLHVLTLTSITNVDCQTRLPAFSHVIYAWTLCMLPAPGNAICDLGNPLVANAQIVGVNAWDAACDGSQPAAHERVAHFRPWIVSVTGDL